MISTELRTALGRVGAQLLPHYAEDKDEDELVIYRPTEEAWMLWLREQKVYMKWNTHKRADYRKANKRIQAGALDFKYVYLCNHAKSYTAQHNPGVPPEKRRKGKDTIKVGCHAKIVARQYTDANQIEIRYRWHHNGHVPQTPLEVLVTKDDDVIREWLALRIGQLYASEPFMDLVRFSAHDFATFELNPSNMAALPDIYRLLRIKPSQVYDLVRQQLVQSSSWPENLARKSQIWQDLIAETNLSLQLMHQKNGYLDDVDLVALWEHFAAVKAQNSKLRDILFPEVLPAAPVHLSTPSSNLVQMSRSLNLDFSYFAPNYGHPPSVLSKPV